MNYMPKVLEMLGVEVGEKFKVKEFDNNPIILIANIFWLIQITMTWNSKI